MKVNQISLEQRLWRLKRGAVSDPEFIVSAVNSMAQIPMHVYLSGFEKEWKRLRLLVGIRMGREKEATYREVAFRIHQMYYQPEIFKKNTGSLDPVGTIENMADEAVGILVLPLRRCCEERKRTYE